jgi:hypothetical protein
MTKLSIETVDAALREAELSEMWEVVSVRGACYSLAAPEEDNINKEQYLQSIEDFNVLITVRWEEHRSSPIACSTYAAKVLLGKSKVKALHKMAQQGARERMVAPFSAESVALAEQSAMMREESRIYMVATDSLISMIMEVATSIRTEDTLLRSKLVAFASTFPSEIEVVAETEAEETEPDLLISKAVFVAKKLMGISKVYMAKMELYLLDKEED